MSGKTDDLKGRAKEAAGDVTDDQDLKDEGKVDRAKGSIKEKATDAKEWVEDKVDSVGDKAKRMLGYRPAVTLQEGLADTAASYRALGLI